MRPNAAKPTTPKADRIWRAGASSLASLAMSGRDDARQCGHGHRSSFHARTLHCLSGIDTDSVEADAVIDARNEDGLSDLVWRLGGFPGLDDTGTRTVSEKLLRRLPGQCSLTLVATISVGHEICPFCEYDVYDAAGCD